MRYSWMISDFKNALTRCESTLSVNVLSHGHLQFCTLHVEISMSSVASAFDLHMTEHLKLLYCIYEKYKINPVKPEM